MKIKILQVFNRYLEYGGEEACVARIRRAMQEHFHVDVHYGSTEESLRGSLAKFRMPYTMQRNQSALREIRRSQMMSDYDVWEVHNVFPAISVAVYELAKELRVPVIQYLHNYRFGCAGANYLRDLQICTDCSPGHFGSALKHRCWRGSLPATVAMVLALRRFWKLGAGNPFAGFVAVSQSMKIRHIEMGFPEDRIWVIPHFLDAGPPPTSLPPKGGDVLFLGRLTEEKGCELLIRAWARVQPGRRKLRIVGEGPALPALKQLVVSLGVHNVEFSGFIPREQHGAVWREASVFVAPSVWEEPFGMVILEAWRHARPVLATNLGSFPEMVEHGVDGWLATPEVDEFAVALQTALDEADRHGTMGLAGRAKLERDFNRDRWLTQIRQVYQKVGS